MELLKQLPSGLPFPVYPGGTHQLAFRNCEYTDIDVKAVTLPSHGPSKRKGNLFSNPQVLSSFRHLVQYRISKYKIFSKVIIQRTKLIG